MSPASSGSSGSDVECVAAPTSSTNATADPSRASPTAAAAARSVAARTVRGPGSTEVASAPKCERCWHYRSDVGSDPAHPTICSRCTANLFGSGEPRAHA